MVFAGQKRQGGSFPTIAACKRRAQGRDWTSLPADIANAIAERLLAADVVDYMIFRAVCAPWRASTLSPRDPTLRNVSFRPRGWVALCDGDGVRPADAGEITFFHTSTSRRIRVLLPELQDHRIVGFTDGLLILLNKGTTAVRVFHPFTRVCINLPPFAPVFWHVLKDLHSMVWMSAAVCLSPTSIAVVAWFPYIEGVVCSEPGHRRWTIIHKSLALWTALPFQGKLFGVKKASRRVVQVYPPSSQHKVVARIPKEIGFPFNCCCHLVESGGHALLVLQQPITDEWSSGEWIPFTVALFNVNISSQKITPVSSLGDRALFLGNDRNISVSAKHLPSICSNAIYISQPTRNPTMMHSLSNRAFEQTSTFSPIHERTGNSVRPFTLADHLLTYCNHTEWARGLMFHEFYPISVPLEKLLMKFRAQDNEVRVPCLTEYKSMLEAKNNKDIL